MKTRTCVVFGGSGYIGTKLAERLLQNKSFDRLYVFDLNPSDLAGERLVSKIADVRRPIEQEIDDFDPDSSWVVDLAAVHREPGHEPREYFDTNVTGAYSVTSFAERLGFKKLFFMSSIAPYGRSLEEENGGITVVRGDPVWDLKSAGGEDPRGLACSRLGPPRSHMQTRGRVRPWRSRQRATHDKSSSTGHIRFPGAAECRQSIRVCVRTDRQHGVRNPDQHQAGAI